MRQPTLYQAYGQVLLTDQRAAGGIATDQIYYSDPGRYVRNQAAIFKSPQVAQRASEILDGALTPGQVQASTAASAATDIDAITVSGTRPTASGAVAVVDAVVQAYGETIQEGIASEVESTIQTLEQAKLDLQVKIAQFDAQLAIDPASPGATAQRNGAVAQLVNIDTRIEQLSTNAALFGSGIQLYVPPEVPGAPFQPRPKRTAAIGLVLGLVAAGGLAWWRAESDQRADDPNAPARVLDAPLFAAVPEFSDAGVSTPIPTITDLGSGAAEAYHFAVTSLSFALGQINGTTVVVTSASPGDGKSVTALNISIAAAQDGRRPLLIDADERARGLTRIAVLGTQPGISDLGNGTPPDRIVDNWAMPDGTIVPFVPAGSKINGSTAGYFRSAPFKAALPALASDRDLVIIDVPPVMSAAESTDLVSQADGVLIVVRSGTPLKDLDNTHQRLAMTDTPILGYVFNRASKKASGYGYGYGYGYGQDAT